jgi:hypothetical protein
MSYLEIIESNYKAEDGSFMYELHEEDCFNSILFDKLVQSINKAGKLKSRDSLDEQPELTRKIMFISMQILAHIIYHLDPRDQSEISNYKDIDPDAVQNIIDVVDEYLRTKE